MEQEAPDELVNRKRRQLEFVVVAVVAPAEAHRIAGERDQAAVADGDTMGIAAEIGQYLLGPSKRALGVNHPVNAS